MRRRRRRTHSVGWHRGFIRTLRLLTLTFPDGNGNQSWTYTPDGLPATVTTSNDGQTVTNSWT